jgi:hypothetical protein
MAITGYHRSFFDIGLGGFSGAAIAFKPTHVARRVSRSHWSLTRQSRRLRPAHGVRVPSSADYELRVSFRVFAYFQ